jgi:hypothetical protein
MVGGEHVKEVGDSGACLLILGGVITLSKPNNLHNKVTCNV